MLLFTVKRTLSVVMAVIVMASMTVTAYAESEAAETAVLWPYDIPFKIIVAQNGKQGMIYSEEFNVANLGDKDVSLEISEARIQIEHEDGYYISDTSELPESGSNIFIELLLLDGQEPSSTVLSAIPSGLVHTYHLKSGEVGKFKFGGNVNELGEAVWRDTTVQIHISFKIAGLDTTDLDEESDDFENNEAIIRDSRDMDEASASSQETLTDTDDTNIADNEDAQETQSDNEAGTEEPDDNASDASSQANDSPSVESGHPDSAELGESLETA